MGRYLTPLSLADPLRPADAPRRPTASSPPIWVHLVALPHPYSHDQAMLICRHSDDQWVVWIPDHGEAILHVSEFYIDADFN